MLGEIIVTAQVKLSLYKSEVNVLLNVLKEASVSDEYSKEVVNGVIKELDKINQIDINL